jgi:hypothetical protein
LPLPPCRRHHCRPSNSACASCRLRQNHCQ